ncbi:MAG TPA: hypothetical protein PKX79_10460 [Spirochaetota bacterium]|jgi:protein arginine kinase|nr:hypothetical protein [Spirochaetota bacterium]HOK01160.1 hypothetical protein [Spirochaetota bacterium]HOK92905.1 hypothetical protein [Spirochaetota bacterium]HON15853.1 hypothetical protein [Spirochaetota bacterium]HPD78443.1 hypothetical protein [Spirochaetota bacterium]
MFTIDEILNNRNPFWTQKGPRNDIVLSSRVRLARNTNLPFAHNLDDFDCEYLFSVAENFASRNQESLKFIKISDLDLHQKRLLREKNIITSEMESGDNSAVIIDKDKDGTILINDTDHFRIQVIKSGFQLHKAFMVAETLDDELNKFVPYTFLDTLGYLSPDPLRCGTGLKVSLILHLPALTILKRISDLVPFVKDGGFQIGGTLAGSGRIVGGLYLLSNKVKFGLSEVEVLDAADDIANRIIKLEDESRDDFFDASRREFEDFVWRALGLLLYSRRINYVEAIENLSRVRLGIIMSVIKEYDLSLVNDLMVKIQWSHLQEYFGIRFKSIVDSDDYRAYMIRSELTKGGDRNV